MINFTTNIAIFFWYNSIILFCYTNTRDGTHVLAKVLANAIARNIRGEMTRASGAIFRIPRCKLISDSRFGSYICFRIYITGAAAAVVDFLERQPRSTGLLSQVTLVQIRFPVAAANRRERDVALFPAATSRLSRAVQLTDFRLHAFDASAWIWN